MNAYGFAEVGAVLFAEAPEALLLADPADGHVCEANPAAERLFARPRAMLCGLPCRALLVTADGPLQLDPCAEGERDVFLLTEGESPVRLPVRLRVRRLT